MQWKNLFLFGTAITLLPIASMSVVSSCYLEQFELRRHRSAMAAAAGQIEYDHQQYKNMERLRSTHALTEIQLHYCQWAPIAFIRYDDAFSVLTRLGETPVEPKSVAEIRAMVCQLRAEFDLPDYHTNQRYRGAMISVSNGKVSNATLKFGAFDAPE